MAKKVLMKGNEAIGEAAILAGCRAYFCYPITPQTEVAEYLARRMPEVGGTFLQGESEVAVGYMLFGAAAGGSKVFSTSSSPGISLMSEALSYIAAGELPVVLVNVMRNGPGLGGILPAQADYMQATRGGGHGDYKVIVLAPSTVQEAVDQMVLAFTLAEKYRNPVMLVADGMIGQMMEPVELPVFDPPPPSTVEGYESWATVGAKGRKQNLVKTLFLNPDLAHAHNVKLKAKYDEVEKNEVRFEETATEGDMDALLVSFGTMARICKTSLQQLSERGLKVGLFRPISLYPFPYARLHDLAARSKVVASIELSMGQLIEDVRLGVEGKGPVKWYGKAGGLVPTPQEVTDAVIAMVSEQKAGKSKRRGV